MPLQDPEGFEREYAASVAPATVVATKPKKVKIAGEADEADDEDFTTVGKGGKAMVFTSESIFQNLQLIQEARGKKVLVIFVSFSSL